MLRVGAEAYQAALRQPHTRMMDFTGSPLKGYIYVDPPGLKTAPALSAWLNRGLDVRAGPEPDAARRQTGRSQLQTRESPGKRAARRISLSVDQRRKNVSAK